MKAGGVVWFFLIPAANAGFLFRRCASRELSFSCGRVLLSSLLILGRFLECGIGNMLKLFPKIQGQGIDGFVPGKMFRRQLRHAVAKTRAEFRLKQ